MHQIICPYCFYKFAPESAIFRANTAFSKSELDLDDDDDGGLLGGKSSADTGTNIKALFRRFDSEDSFSSDKKLDEKLIAHWADRGGKSGYEKFDKNWDYPHMDPADPHFRDMISFVPAAGYTPDKDGFVRHKDDGFPHRVLDRFSDPAKPMTRLCPGCHNPLPLPDYGKYPVIFISVVGITGAGKTVYLNQLLTRFSDALEGTGYRVASNNLAAIGESVCPDRPLPASTDDKIMRRPLAVTLMSDRPLPNQAKGLSIVFYDIAGENCVNAKGEADVQQARSTIGNFIAYSDGLIFLIDPQQLPPFAVESDLRPSNIMQVVDVMNNIRSEINADKPGWEDIPVAVTIAKSDKLRNCAQIPRDNPIFAYPNENLKEFDRRENIVVNTFLSTLLRDTANSVVAPLNSFKKRNYFAVSAITCGVESRFEKYQNRYILDEINQNKFMKLRRWITGWNQRTPENRPYFQKCPVLTKDGSPIVFDYDVDITEANAGNIVTEIFAGSELCDDIFLTMWDVSENGVNLSGYPMADPAPRRVEDPLKWILWKLQLMAPYFTPQTPRRRKTLEREKVYNEYLEGLRAANELDFKRWYGDLE